MKKVFICILISLFMMTSCTDNDVQENQPATSGTISDITETASETNKIIDAELPEEAAETESSYISQQPEEKLFCSIDLNYDGITEDFFIWKNIPYDEFHIVMYDDTEKTNIIDETTINRTDKIDIYKCQLTSDGEYIHEYAYYAVFRNSGYYRSRVELLYTGGTHDKGFSNYEYGEDFRDQIYCYRANSIISKEGFDDLLTNTPDFLKEYENLEYVETIDLNEFLNEEYSEEYISDISICDGMADISLYDLQNDIFGRDFKLTNGNYTYYSFKTDSIEIYKRIRKVQDYDESLTPFIIEGSEEYDYLLCLKASDEKTAELIYLGTPGKDWIVSYYAYAYISDSPTQSGIDTDIENFNSIMNDSVSFLKENGWDYERTIEINFKFDKGENQVNLFNDPEEKNNSVSGPDNDFLKIDVKELIDWNEPNGAGCFVSDMITKEGWKVGYMFREEPLPDRPDSGWYFYKGDEDEEYSNDPNNFHIFHINTICNYDPDIIPYLYSPVGTHLIRTSDGKFIVDDGSAPIHMEKQK